MSALIPAPGLVLGDRYRLVRQLAVGGMGQVWVAQDESLSREVAIKVLKPEFAGNTEFLRRLRTEARNAASLSHRGIAQLFDYGERDGIGYLVLELVVGEPMSDLLERSPVLPLDQTLSIIAQTARALHSAHLSGVVHRDVKPGNILLERDGTVKITDFGVSLAADQAPMTATGMVMGTAQYLSPEQAVGKPATPTSDIYALGVIAFEALVGHRPFTGKTAVDIAVAHVNEPIPPLPSSVPPDVATLIQRMLAKDPSERPRSGAQLATMVEELMVKYRAHPWLGSIGAQTQPLPPISAEHGNPVNPSHAAPTPPRAQRAGAIGGDPRHTPGGRGAGAQSPAEQVGGRPAPAVQRNSVRAKRTAEQPAVAPPGALGTFGGTGRGGAGAAGGSAGTVRTPAGAPGTFGGTGRPSGRASSAQTGPRESRNYAGRQQVPTPRPSQTQRPTSTTTGRRWGNWSWQAFVLIGLVIAVVIASLIGLGSRGSDNKAAGLLGVIGATESAFVRTDSEQYKVMAGYGIAPHDGAARSAAPDPTRPKDV
ncbi:serine/threonine-protein kinase [Rarobacter incanus]|uniref:non-specific serine/threonine protein kinase n=1 Tax=Rarobacter incanus TaxID=153494 RepID=A0A542SPV8_9MICO|nr:serine/threonine-protein kinase [Rarobacter incanus]TQK76646.1 serine/threonine-protein kinase [Rarobacter incanus]